MARFADRPQVFTHARRYLGIVLLGLLSLVVATGDSFALETGKPAPAFRLNTPEGKSVALVDFSGRIVLLKIGTTWCPGCQEQDKELAVIADFLTKEQVAVIEVFVDEGATEVKRYLKDHTLKTTVTPLLGDDNFATKYGVYLIPRVLILDGQQRVVYDGGGTSAKQIQAYILQTKAKSH